MKTEFKLIFASAIFFCAGCNQGTVKIEYGSANGKQVSINSIKIYYIEYGQGTPLLLLSGGWDNPKQIDRNNRSRLGSFTS